MIRDWFFAFTAVLGSWLSLVTPAAAAAAPSTPLAIYGTTATHGPQC